MLAWSASELHAGGANAELAVRLNSLGSKGTAPFLASALLRLLGRINGASAPAGDTATAAQLLATAAANMAQVAYGPLPEAQATQPLAALLNGMKVCFRSSSHSAPMRSCFSGRRSP